MKRTIYSFILVMIFAANISAADASTLKAEEFVRSVADDALTVITSSQSDAEKQGRLETIFKNSVDIKWIGRFVLGKHWRSASEQQRSSYFSAYEKFLVKNYTSQFGEFSGQRYKVKSAKKQPDGDILVTLEIAASGQPVVLTDFRVRRAGNNYKVIDIIVEGVSLITTQRSEFNSVINRKGLDFLVKALNKKS